MTAPTPHLPVLKVVSITDLGITVVELPQGRFLIDSEIVTNEGFNSYNQKRQVSVRDVDNIRQIHTKKIISKYQDESGNEMTVSRYDDRTTELLSNAEHYDDEVQWKNLDDEFEYRRFVSTWKPVYKEIVQYSEPLLVEFTYIKQDTGNPHITAGFMTNSGSPLYDYNRSTAVASCLHAKFKSLGMEYKEGVNYGATEGKKLYGNSTHSGLEYVTAFGKYIIGKDLVRKTVGQFKGSLEHLESMYEADKKWIDDHIQGLYNLHFRNEAASGVLIGEVHKKMLNVRAFVNTMDVKVKSETSKRSALKVIDGLIDLVNKEILENTQES